ncbi:MAG: hypothetical protein ABI426_12045 [Flavobacterium sp.]
MKPLIVLIISFLFSITILKLLGGNYDFQLAGRISMAIMLLFTSIGHFKFLDGMKLMLPDILPQKKLIIYTTGILEIGAAILLLFNESHKIAACFIILLFIFMLPANINATLKHVDHENATYNGKGVKYLWFRIPLQVFFILWVYFSSYG